MLVESRLAPAFFTLLCAGHTLRRLAAKDGYSEGSMSREVLKLWILFWKDEQWANPRVWPPEQIHAHQSLSEMAIYKKKCYGNVLDLSRTAPWPDLYVPESATRSSRDRPLWEKLCCSWEMLNVGKGNCLVSVAFEILPSFLPFGTCQVGPPD